MPVLLLNRLLLSTRVLDTEKNRSHDPNRHTIQTVWPHPMNYQFERQAGIFISLYLPVVLEWTKVVDQARDVNVVKRRNSA